MKVPSPSNLLVACKFGFAALALPAGASADNLSKADLQDIHACIDKEAPDLRAIAVITHPGEFAPRAVIGARYGTPAQYIDLGTGAVVIVGSHGYSQAPFGTLHPEMAGRVDIAVKCYWSHRKAPPVAPQR